MHGADSDVSAAIADENMSLVAGDAKCVKGFVPTERFGECGTVDIMHGQRAGDAARAHDER